MTDDAMRKIIADIITKDEHKDILELPQTWSDARMACRKERQLATYHEIDNVHRSFEWSKPENGCSRLMWRGTNEVAELDVSGIAVDCFFGPVTEKTRLRARAPHELLQKIEIAAPRNANFELALVAIDAIYTVAEQKAREGQIRPLEWTTFEDQKSLTANRRFLTPSRFMLSTTSILPLPNDIDPQGRLRKFTESPEGEYRYTTDNHVECLEVEYTGLEAMMTKQPCSSLNIRRGQAVEVTLTFSLVTAGKQQKFLTQVKEVLIVNRVGSMLSQRLHREHKAALRSRDVPRLSAPPKRHIEDPMFDQPPAKRAHTVTESECNAASMEAEHTGGMPTM